MDKIGASGGDLWEVFPSPRNASSQHTESTPCHGFGITFLIAVASGSKNLLGDHCAVFHKDMSLVCWQMIETLLQMDNRLKYLGGYLAKCQAAEGRSKIKQMLSQLTSEFGLSGVQNKASMLLGAIRVA